MDSRRERELLQLNDQLLRRASPILLRGFLVAKSCVDV
jgi:hypothetical protein